MKAGSGGPGVSGVGRTGRQWTVPAGESKLDVAGRGSGLKCMPLPSPLPAAFTWPSQHHLAPAWTQGHTQAHAHELMSTSHTPQTRSRHRAQFHSADSGPVATYLYNFRQISPLGSKLLSGPVSLSVINLSSL